MKATRGMDPQGLKARWAAGAHQQAAVSLQAEQFCLACHVKAPVGEVLGTVTVRSDLARKEAVWWQEVRPTAGALRLKNLAHTFLLLLLLKVRMEPLGNAGPALGKPLARVRHRFGAITQALARAAPPLRATEVQSVAASGQRVLQRLQLRQSAPAGSPSA